MRLGWSYLPYVSRNKAMHCYSVATRMPSSVQQAEPGWPEIAAGRALRERPEAFAQLWDIMPEIGEIMCN